MGDRTWAHLVVLESMKDRVTPLIDPCNQDFTTERTSALGKVQEFHQFDYEEMNYGEVPGLAELRKAGIAYDSFWGNGNEFTQGGEHCRFDADGDAIVTTVYDDRRGVDLDGLLPIIDDPVALRKYILAHRDRITYLSWDNQEENGNLQRTIQLLTT